MKSAKAELMISTGFLSNFTGEILAYLLYCNRHISHETKTFKITWCTFFIVLTEWDLTYLTRLKRFWFLSNVCKYRVERLLSCDKWCHKTKWIKPSSLPTISLPRPLFHVSFFLQLIEVAGSVRVGGCSISPLSWVHQFDAVLSTAGDLLETMDPPFYSKYESCMEYSLSMGFVIPFTVMVGVQPKSRSVLPGMWGGCELAKMSPSSELVSMFCGPCGGTSARNMCSGLYMGWLWGNPAWGKSNDVSWWEWEYCESPFGVGRLLELPFNTEFASESSVYGKPSLLASSSIVTKRGKKKKRKLIIRSCYELL